MKHYYDELSAAIGRKSAIIAEIQRGSGAYYSTVTLPSKKSTSILFFSGHPVKGEYQEAQINWGAINARIQEADQSINHHFTMLQAEFGKVEKETASSVGHIKAEASVVSQTVASLGSQISSYRSEYSRLQAVNWDLNTKISQEKARISGINYQIDQSKIKIQALNEQIRLETEVHSQNQAHIKVLKEEVTVKGEKLIENIQQVNAQTEKLLHSITNQQRSVMLINLLGKVDEDSKKLVTELSKLEFDVYYTDKQGRSLITAAIIQNDLALFDLIVSKNPRLNLEIPTIESKTVLQYALAYNYNELAEKILKTSTIFTRTLLLSLKQDDQITLDKLFLEKPELCKKVFQGHTLLQLAIADNKPDIVQKIIATDETTVSALNFKGESALNIALKLKHAEIIRILAEHVDVKTELRALIKADEIDLASTLLETVPELIDKIDKTTLFGLVLSGSFGAARMLLDHGAHYDETLTMSMQQKNKAVFVGLIKVAPDCLQETKIDKALLSDAAHEFGVDLAGLIPD